MFLGSQQNPYRTPIVRDLSLRKPEPGRRGASLRLYFEDVSLEADYRHQLTQHLAGAAERRRFVAEHGDLYTQPDTFPVFTEAELRESTDQVDGDDNKVDIDNCGLNEAIYGISLAKTWRRRRLPATRRGDGGRQESRYDSAATVAVGEHPVDEKLVEAVKRNDAETVHKILKRGDNPNLKYNLTSKEADDLRFVFGSFQEDESTSWSVLHEASARAHWRCVRALLAVGADVNVNVARRLTPLDVAGAAHHHTRLLPDDLVKVVQMLLEAGGTFTGMKDGEVRGGEVLHTAVELESVETIQLLLDAGASVACRDTAGLTPLHVALKNKSANILQVLLNYSCTDAAELRARVGVSDGRGLSALQAAVLQGWRSGARVLLDAGADLTSCATHAKALLWRSPHWYLLLQSRQTPLHLAVARNDEHILDMMIDRLPNVETLNCQNQDGETPLFTAIKQGHLRCVKKLVYEGASIRKVSVKSHNALHVAAEYDRVEIMKFLLEFEDDLADTMNGYNRQGCAPLHSAAMNDNPECVTMLAANGADVRLRTLGHHSLTALHVAAGYNYPAVAAAILRLDKTTIDEVDERGFSPLHVAIHNCCRDVMMLLLNDGATLAATTKGKSKDEKTAIEMLTNKLPNPAEFLEGVFDSFITSENAFAKTKINVNYQVLGKASEVQQMKAVEELLRCGQESVLIHPLLESLLYLKWQTLLPFFYVILATYAFFVLSLNVLVVSAFYYIDRKASPPVYLNQQAWNIVLVISIFLLLVQEYFYISVKRRRYLTYLESWVKLGSIVLAGVLSGAAWCSLWAGAGGEWPRHVATAALALAWGELMVLLSRFPNWGYYVLMFGSISVTIIKILLTFMFLMVAFSLSFMIQFQATPPFDGPWSALLKTLVMMTSEFDYVALFSDDNFTDISTSRVAVGLLFLCFLVFVSVVFMNFMVGVAVSDISDLNIRGNTKRLAKLVELLSTLDVVVHDSGLRKILPKNTFNKINNQRFIHKMTTFPGSEKTWSVMCGNRTHKLESESEYSVCLPKSLADAIVQRANRHTARQEGQSASKAYMDKIDELYEAVVNKDQLVRQSTVKDQIEKLENIASEIVEIKKIQMESLRKMDEVLQSLQE